MMKKSPLSPSSSSSPKRGRIELLRITSRHPPVTVDDLAQMLQTDLALGHVGDFHKRLTRALEAAAGFKHFWPPRSSPGIQS